MQVLIAALSAGSFIGVVILIGILGKIANAFMQMNKMFGGGKRK